MEDPMKKTEDFTAYVKTTEIKLLWAAVVFLAAITCFSVSNAAVVSYSYDDAGRLTAVDYGEGKNIRYSYDPGGNLLERVITASPGLKDAIMALQILAHINPASGVYVEADVDGDGEIGLAEAIYALQKISGLGN